MPHGSIGYAFAVLYATLPHAFMDLFIVCSLQIYHESYLTFNQQALSLNWFLLFVKFHKINKNNSIM